MKICIDCGLKESVERRRCKECVQIYNNKRAHDYYVKKGKQRRKENLNKSVCVICGGELLQWREGQLTHLGCRHKCIDDYNKVPRDKKGCVLVRSALLCGGVFIPPKYVIHHIDENPYNNSKNNLWLLPRGAHASLHRKLQKERSLWLKNHSSNDENCWKIIRDHITTTWLETTSVNVIKICDIWKPAAEPLDYYKILEEGSETMHVEPKSKDKVKI